ncbi:hypothetical protein HS088_TW10G00300 [Tripterygium wilfordii]|uniref:Uncharacterized protein n=1 Tax=Tripterygium wilfordii TaxID=458696 RepID=A0A7J7D4N2_TRIWF|nr:hypothetical protein HS088_TW10G00300 [Tripterygium wilfordii]
MLCYFCFLSVLKGVVLIMLLTLVMFKILVLSCFMASLSTLDESLLQTCLKPQRFPPYFPFIFYVALLSFFSFNYVVIADVVLLMILMDDASFLSLIFFKEPRDIDKEKTFGT